MLPPHHIVQPGDKYDWLWHGWPDTTGESGTILRAESHEIIKFTFGGDVASLIVVTVSIIVKNSVSIIELTQENIPDTDFCKSYLSPRMLRRLGILPRQLKVFFRGRY